jgi:small subunit ribosomal protein S6
VATKKKVEVKTAVKGMQDYELVFIVSPGVADEALESRISNVSQFITTRGGTVASMEKWGKKKLAYPLKRFLEGNYVLARFSIDPARCKELEANLRISEEILRHLLVKVGA